MACELAKRGKKVLILEKGSIISRIGTEAAAVNFYDKFGKLSTIQGNIVYRAIMVGGSTVVSCGNGVRSLEHELKRLGVDISVELDEARRELSVKLFDLQLMGDGTRRIMEASYEAGIPFVPMPKFVDFTKCISCGNCVLGCMPRAKWTALDFVQKAQEYGATLATNFILDKIVVSGGRAVGVEGTVAGRKIDIKAQKIIISAGAVETPVILQKTGIECGNKIFCDLYSIVYGISDVGLSREPAMAIFNDDFYEKKGFILSTFLDTPLSLMMTDVRYYQLAIKRDKLLGIMVKIKDDMAGKVFSNGKISKIITSYDKIKLNTGIALAEKILAAAKIKNGKITVTKARGAHPGGTVAIGEIIDQNQETKIKNLFVSDASVLPEAPGLPPILTIVALSKRLAKILC